jgi:hypothetical protein
LTDEKRVFPSPIIPGNQSDKKEENKVQHVRRFNVHYSSECFQQEDVRVFDFFKLKRVYNLVSSPELSNVCPALYLKIDVFDFILPVLCVGNLKNQVKTSHLLDKETDASTITISTSYFKTKTDLISEIKL